MSKASTPAASSSRGGGLSLYANLLDPSSSSTGTSAASISRAPVVFKQGSTDSAQGDDASAKKQQINPASLRFQPTKRPQLSNQKSKPKSTYPKTITPSASEPARAAPSSNITRPSVKSTLADWTAAGDDNDVNGFYGGGEKRQRGGRKKRKKNREEQVVVQDWDDVYDPSRPNNYDEYKHSDEKVREVKEWKDRLYAHRMARRQSSDRDSDEEDQRRPTMSNQFAPPSNYSFAPPPIEAPSQAPINATDLIDEKTGDEAYARRLKLSQAQQSFPSPPPVQAPTQSPANTPPPPSAESLPVGVIARAPVRYELSLPPSEIPSSEVEFENALAEGAATDEGEPPVPEDAPRSLRPGQKGFAERLMSKYGWNKGTGLGADGSGIVNPLRVQVEKRRKKPDAEGGGFADPKGIGKIIGGKKASTGKDTDTGKFGAMSEVIILYGMVDGMNLDKEFEDAGDGGLMQEIGDECSEKYGNVERVYVDRSRNSEANVFVKFTSQLSALRAVNALEGRIFNGNTITAKFYDTERFERGIYEPGKVPS